MSFNGETTIREESGCPLCGVLRVEYPEDTGPRSPLSAMLCCFSIGISSTAAVAEPPAAFLAIEATEGLKEALVAHSTAGTTKVVNDDDFDFDCTIALTSCCVSKVLCCYVEPPCEPQQQVM